MNITTENRHGVMFIRVIGSLDIMGSERFEEVLGEVLQENNSRIVFDLEECSGITSKALGLLMWAKAEAKGAGGDAGGGCRLIVTTSSGLPRSQARLSLSPKMWQLAQDASPFPEVATAS